MKLTFGTDSGVYPHGDNAKQFAYMVRYGMTPMQAIQAATLNGADALGLKDQTGALAAGLAADIIAVKRRSARGHPCARAGRLRDEGAARSTSSNSLRITAP